MGEDDRPATAPDGYRPTVSPRYAEQIRRWHENAYRSAQTEAGTGQTFDYLGLTLHVPPEVMPITPVSELLGRAVLAEVRAGDRVLDMGTGSGVNAILAASTATEVVAVDINPRAVDAARQNAARNGVAGRVDVRHGDVFSTLDGQFDLIVFDPPFRWFRPRTLLEMASTDENYRALTRFVRDAGRYLRANGRMLMFFGTSGDLGYLHRLLADEGFTAETLAHADTVKDGMRVDYYTYRVTRGSTG